VTSGFSDRAALRPKMVPVDLSTASPIRLFVTAAGPGDTAYPKLSALPTSYNAQQINQSFDIDDDGNADVTGTAGSSYTLYYSLHYIPEGSICVCVQIPASAGNSWLVLTVYPSYGGFRTERPFWAPLAASLASGGTSTISVTYANALGDTVSDTIPVQEKLGLPSGVTLASGTNVFVVYDPDLNKWCACAAQCASS
jgi:hypothetical protein